MSFSRRTLGDRAEGTAQRRDRPKKRQRILYSPLSHILLGDLPGPCTFTSQI